MKSRSSKVFDKLLALKRMFKSYAVPHTYSSAVSIKAKRGSSSNGVPNKMAEECCVTCENIAGNTCYVFKGNNSCIMYLHGGIFVNDITSWHWRFIAKLNKLTGSTIVVVKYGRLPSDNATALTNSMTEVYRQLAMRYSHENITFMGDSAGGGLILSVANNLIDVGEAQPKQIICLSPWLDVEMKNPKLVKSAKTDYMLRLNELKLFGEVYSNGCDNNYVANPINRIDKRVAPVSIFVGGSEMLLPDCLRYKSLADSVGASVSLFEMPYMQHVFVVLPCPEAEVATNMIANIVLGR